MSTLIGWTELAIIGLGISYLLSVLVYMLSYIFSSEMMRAWAKHEIQSALLTLLLFTSLVGISSQSVIKDYRQGAANYMKGLYNDVFYCQESVFKGINTLSIISSISINFNPQIFNLGGRSIQKTDQPAASGDGASNQNRQSEMGSSSTFSTGISLGVFLQPIISTFSDFQSYMIIPFGLLQFHIRLFDVFSLKGVEMILPVGIFMRAFKFSRNGGNLLIALFIALYFILPAMYLFSFGLMKEKFDLSNNNNICESKKPGIIMDFLGPVASAAGMTAFAGVPGGPSLSNSDSFTKVFSDNAEDLKYNKDFQVLFLRVGIESMLLPMFAIIVTLGLAREFALLLGSDIDFSQLVRVV